jgi:hypothetical protein
MRITGITSRYRHEFPRKQVPKIGKVGESLYDAIQKIYMTGRDNPEFVNLNFIDSLGNITPLFPHISR